MNDYIGMFQGIKVKSIPDKDFKGPIIIPECMVKYLEKSETMRKEYNNLHIEQIFGKRSKIMNKQKYDKAQVWEDIITEYFNRHPDAGLAWWQLPLEEQPEEFKQEMYDIMWDLTHKENKDESL